MCIAILNSPNITLPKSLIKNSWDNNSDGGGIMWVDTEKNILHIHKEVYSFEAFYNKYVEIRKSHPKSNVVLHFRIGTSGGINYNNTHPFLVHKNLGFVHNGIIHDLNGINQHKSDTNLFNELVLQKLDSNFINNDGIITLISKYIGTSKLIFLNNKNEFLIINEHKGVSDDNYKGCWFSNSTYMVTDYYDRGGVKVKKSSSKTKLLPLFETTEDINLRMDNLEAKGFDNLTESEWQEYMELWDKVNKNNKFKV